MDTTITNSNQSDGAITKITVIRDDHFHYHWLLLAILASGLLAWALRKIFWGRDSN